MLSTVCWPSCVQRWHFIHSYHGAQDFVAVGISRESDPPRNISSSSSPSAASVFIEIARRETRCVMSSIFWQRHFRVQRDICNFNITRAAMHNIIDRRRSSCCKKPVAPMIIMTYRAIKRPVIIVVHISSSARSVEFCPYPAGCSILSKKLSRRY